MNRAHVRGAVAGALAGWATPAGAHGSEHAFAWTFSPWVVVPLLAMLVLFVAGQRRLATQGRPSRVHRRRTGWFAAGWTVLAAALVTPLHAAGERSFAAHMLEHELLMLVAAPLLVLARPLAVALWALPAAWRPRVAHAAGAGLVGRTWRAWSSPVAATAAQAAALWAWHAPAAFDLALRSEAWHIAQHVSFLATALVFWWAILRPGRQRAGVAVACLFATSIVGGALGALMALSSGPWYAGYQALAQPVFGLTPAEDQQLAGVLMWVPGGLVHAGAGLALLARMLAAPRRRTVVRGDALPLLLGALVAAAPPVRAETIYVSDEAANVVHVIAPPDWRVQARIPVGRRPRGLQVGEGGAALYVATSNDDRVEVVDLATGTVRRTLASGPDPERFALSPDGTLLAVANEDDAVVSFLDVASGRLLAEVPVGAEPEGMAYSPDGRWVICTAETSSLVHFIDAATRTLVDSVAVGTRPRDAVFSRDGRWLWVSSEMRATVAVFDMATRRPVRTIDFAADPDAPVGVQAVGLALTADGKRAFVALGRGNHVAEIEPSSGRVVRYVPVGERTWSIALSPDETRLYAANGLSGDVTVIDLASNRPIATVRTGGRPWGVVVTP